MTILTCPAVLCISYFSGNVWHEMYLTFNIIDGTTTVGLRIFAEKGCWSGWHGRWSFDDRQYTVHVHYRGDENQLRKRIVVLDPIYSWGGSMYDRGAKVAVIFSMKTKVLSQKMLADEKLSWSLQRLLGRSSPHSVRADDADVLWVVIDA
jgi:hypothetical protein